MERPKRFDNGESKFYETSLPPSMTPAQTPTTHSWSTSTRQPSEEIDLHDLHDWSRRARPQQSWIDQRDIEESTKTWPSVVVEKPVASREFADDVSMKTPGAGYDQNFLHPPTPNRESFAGSGLAGGRGGDDDDDTTELRSRRLSVNLEQSSRFGWWTLGLLFFTVLMITLTAIYSNGSAKNLWQDKFFTTSSSNAILILRIMTEACALLLGALVVVVVEDLQWALASRPQGVGLLHFVGLDAGTGVWGLLRLLATADWHQKYSSLFR